MQDLIALTATAQLLSVAVHFAVFAGSGDFAGNKVDQLMFNLLKSETKCTRNGRMANTWPISKPTQIHMPFASFKEKFEATLAQEGVVGLSIATRPDCLPDDVVEYLAELNGGRIYGLSSVYKRCMRKRLILLIVPMIMQRMWKALKNCVSMAFVFAHISLTDCLSKTMT